jgi:heme-degrading monooxygenase HmoA
MQERHMFSVIFEVRRRPGQWDVYLSAAKALRLELQATQGFVDNIRYRSLTRDGWILSLSGWRDEEAIVGWRTAARHQQTQRKGRAQILADYHLRVGQITRDTRLPDGCALTGHGLDHTETGDATTLTLIDAQRPADLPAGAAPDAVARGLGLDPAAPGLVGWDIFDAVLQPGDLILLLSWRDACAADRHEAGASLPTRARLRRVRVQRDYGMFDRREAPQHLPDAVRTEAD